MSQPLFSIVIACYNNEAFVREAVESALRQNHPSTEIIAVDDASKDGTADVLKSFGDSIIFAPLAVNGGAATARNHGASIARGRYLVLLDGDDVLTPWALSVYDRIVSDRSPILLLGRSSLFYGSAPKLPAKPASGVRLVEYPTFLDKDRPWVYNTSSFVVERAAFLKAGGWSPEIFQQDIQDLLSKLCVAGKTDLVLAPATVLYRMHSTNAIRRVSPFIDGINVLLTKARNGAYPVRRSFKMSAWFGGLIFYWAKEGMRNGAFFKGLKLLLANGWMVAIATLRRALAWITGRRPAELLSLEPNGSGYAAGSHSAHPLAGTISGESQG